jgi:glycerophosphoryl diester phosphodiesterase
VTDRAGRPTTVAHRAGNSAAAAILGAGLDLIELDAHVFRGRVELRHAKVLRPSSRLWEQWYLLPRGTRGVPIAEVLNALEPEQPLLVDLKCFTRRAARRILAEISEDRPILVACRSWWVLRVARGRPNAAMLRSCANRLQVRLATAIPGLGERTGVTVHARLLDADTVAEFRARTPLVYTWGFTGGPEVQALTELGVTGVITDDPAWCSPEPRTS